MTLQAKVHRYFIQINERRRHFLQCQRPRQERSLSPAAIRRFIIGKSDCGKTTLLNNIILCDGCLKYDQLYVFGKSLHQPIYRVLQQALGTGFTKEDILNLVQCKGKSPYSLIDVVNALPPPRHPSGIETFSSSKGAIN